MMPAVLKLIEKQQALWGIKERLESDQPHPGRYFEAGVGYGPCLFISRECGAGGGQVARMAGERLGWQVYDREIVDGVAQLAHARQSMVESVDEKIRTHWESTWRPALNSEDVGCETYLRYLHELIMTLGHHGEVVILGRGAQYFLPPQCALRVRMVAPLEKRVQRMAKLRELPLNEARSLVEHLDEERAVFIRKRFCHDARSPLGYDLTINSGAVSFEVAVELVLAGLREKLGVTTKSG